jgi:hypothetical protein
MQGATRPKGKGVEIFLTLCPQSGHSLNIQKTPYRPSDVYIKPLPSPGKVMVAPESHFLDPRLVVFGAVSETAKDSGLEPQ